MLTDEITREVRRTLIENRLKIRNKRKETVPFHLNRAQRRYWDKARRRNLILKARQKGITKIIDADQFMQCMIRPTTAVVISHESDSTKRLFEAVKFYTQNMTPVPYVSIDSASMMKFPKRGSSFFVGTAGQRAFGRGDTIDRAHLSEAAFYPDLKGTLAGVSEAAEYGIIDIESTPNGMEEFHSMWLKAKAGKSPYTPIFIPWFIDGEYSVDELTLAEKEGMSDSVIEMFAIPEDEFVWTEEEKALYLRVLEEWGIELTIGQIKWRRYKIWDKDQLFWQEYPEDDVSCFLQSGRSVFKRVPVDGTKKIPLDDVLRMKAEDRARLLGTAENGHRRKLLYAGIDPSEGTELGDPHSFAVLEPGERTGRATVIYELTANDPIDIFAEKVAKICDVFNIQLGVEKNGVGVAMCRKLDDLDIAYDEWVTGPNTRPMMVTELEEAYRKDYLQETYSEAAEEALGMIYNKKNRPEHPNGKHDDRVFARAIAWQQMKVPAPGLDWID